MAEQFQLQLVDSHMLYDSCRHMVFRRVDGQAFRFIAGQFIQLHFQHDGADLRRSYSVATVSEDPQSGVEQIEIAVSYVSGGAATELLSAMQNGDRIDASGPYGRFVLNAEPERRNFLIATGTGVTPYRAMLPQIRSFIEQANCQFVLLFGCRHGHEVLYADEFQAMHEQVEGFEYIPCLSRTLAEDSPDNVRRGYVQTQLQQFSPDPGTDIAYLCGNPDMVDDCFRMLKEAGLPVPKIRREKYVSPVIRTPKAPSA